MRFLATVSLRHTPRVVIFLLFLASVWFVYTSLFAVPSLTRTQVAALIGPHLDDTPLPAILQNSEGSGESFALEYSIVPEVQAQADALFKNYKPDYGAVVILDADTGEILALSSFTRDARVPKNLALQSSFPAASIFKVVTAAAALDKTLIGPETTIPFSGGRHTLYRRNVYEKGSHRWTTRMSLKEAFAHSVNTVFAKVGLLYLTPDLLSEYALRFRFSEQIESDVSIETSKYLVPSGDSWKMAETASGFNRNNTLSPIQGAMIAAAVVNDGSMMKPHIVKRVFNSQGDLVYEAVPELESQVINLAASKKLRQMMEATVKGGTSRKIFNDLIRRPAFEEVEFGGKTGSLTGTNPEGKTDWFVGYARSDDRKIAIAALTIHKEYWTVRSAYLARRLLELQLKYRSRRQAGRKPAKNRS